MAVACRIIGTKTYGYDDAGRMISLIQFNGSGNPWGHL